MVSSSPCATFYASVGVGCKYVLLKSTWYLAIDLPSLNPYCISIDIYRTFMTSSAVSSYSRIIFFYSDLNTMAILVFQLITSGCPPITLANISISYSKVVTSAASSFYCLRYFMISRYVCIHWSSYCKLVTSLKNLLGISDWGYLSFNIWRI